MNAKSQVSTASARSSVKNGYGSKIRSAHRVFKQLNARSKGRTEVINAFVEKVGVTPATASSYYQQFAHAKPESTRARGRSRTRGDAVRARGRPIDEESKAGVARQIYKRLAGKKPRKDILQAFMKEAHLTPAGSSTYYQKMKSAEG